MTALLGFTDVACRRGGRLVFEGLSLDLGPGEALQVVGPNGSGKSSLIRLAAGLLRAEAGSVEAAPCALIDAAVALDRELPLRDALGFWGGDVERGIDAMELADFAAVPVRLLSAGQAKRAALARVVASAAPLWLLDEPANALDTRGLKALAAAITRHLRSDGAVVAASHTVLPGDWRTLELGQ